MFGKKKLLNWSLEQLKMLKQGFQDLKSQKELDRGRIIAIKKQVENIGTKLFKAQEKCLFFGIRSDLYSAWIEFDGFHSEIFNFLYLDGVSIDDDYVEENEEGGAYGPVQRSTVA
jgi:hypothetical protein